MADGDLILVTGASGFIAKECIVHALANGYRIRGTIRRPEAEAGVRAIVPDAGDRLSFVKADLLADEGWDAAMRGCRLVLHVASPYPLAAPRDRMALVPPARDGTLRVLKAAVRGEVERVVVTSSLAAVISGHHSSRRDRPFAEGDWSDPDSSNISPYSLSKTLAERAAWDFMQREGGATSMVSVNPGGVYGPARDRAVEASAEIIAGFMKGRYPLVPHLGMGIVDVRDVATAHLAAATVPEAAGRRFLLSAGPMLMIEIGRLLGTAFPKYRSRMPRAEMPDWLVHVYALFNAAARTGIPELGEAPKVDTGPARTVLGLTFRPADEAITAMAQSLIDLKMV